MTANDREPQPSDGPDYSAEHAAWEQRSPAHGDEPENPNEARILATEHPGNCSDCGHSSDCSLHNRPAMAVQSCDCAKSKAPTTDPKSVCRHCGRQITTNVAVSPIGGRVWPYMHIDGTVVCQKATYAEPVETTHECPPAGSDICPCCGKTPFDLPLTDRLTLDPSRVTCTGVTDG